MVFESYYIFKFLALGYKHYWVQSVNFLYYFRMESPNILRCSFFLGNYICSKWFLDKIPRPWFETPSRRHYSPVPECRRLHSHWFDLRIKSPTRSLRPKTSQGDHIFPSLEIQTFQMMGLNPLIVLWWPYFFIPGIQTLLRGGYIPNEDWRRVWCQMAKWIHSKNLFFVRFYFQNLLFL